MYKYPFDSHEQEPNEAGSDSHELKPDEADYANKKRKELADLNKAEAKIERVRQENSLRKTLGVCALWFVGIQLAVCDIVMGIYIIRTMLVNGSVPSEILIGWMTACLVEIIGVLWVIARSLFPFKDRHRDKDAESKYGRQ